MWDGIITWAISFLTGLASSNPLVMLILTVLGTLLAAAQAIVLITPSTADDAWWAKVQALPLIGPFLVMLMNFAPWHKAPPAK